MTTYAETAFRFISKTDTATKRLIWELTDPHKKIAKAKHNLITRKICKDNKKDIKKILKKWIKKKI